MSADAALHAALRQAHAAGRLEIAVAFAAVNRSGAPGFRTTDIVVPPFLIVVFSAYLFASAGPPAGLAALSGGLLLYWLWFRPWSRRRTEARARSLALARPEDWERFWQLGALALRAADGAECRAPKDDWRAFARRFAAAP